MSQSYDPPTQAAQYGSALPDQPSPPATTLTRRPPWVHIATIAAVAIVMGLVGFFLGRGTAGGDDSGSADVFVGHGTALQNAYDDCADADSDNTVSVADGGQSIIIDTRSKYGDPAGMDCILAKLDTPQSVRARIGSTTAMMGVQDADHDGLHYSWSYHPDNGVNMTIEAVD